MSMKKEKQPMPKSGTEFTGWAVFNWGRCWNKVFRTRKEAKEWCVKNSGKIPHKDGVIQPTSWDEIKDHMAVVKVKCKVV